MVLLKELILTVSTLEGEVVLKELIFTSFYFRRGGGLERTELIHFHFGKVWWF